MILVFTPAHKWYPVLDVVFDAVDATVPAPFTHLITDDFSPAEDAAEYQKRCGEIERGDEIVGKRMVKLVSGMGHPAANPNVGLQYQHAFRIAQGIGGTIQDCEGILCIIYKTKLWPGVVEAFREVQAARGAKAGLIAGLITRPEDMDNAGTVYSFGGVREDYGIGNQGAIPGVHVEQKLGAWRGDWPASPPRLGTIPWAHFTCLWIPRSTFMRKDIMPDAAFKMYYADHDLSHQVKSKGMEIVVTDRAVCECGGRGLMTDGAWGKREEQPDPHSGPWHQMQKDGLVQLQAKWG